MGCPDIFFNENDIRTSVWLRELYPEAWVSPRSIEELTPADVSPYRRVHLFGGIGGWEYALRLAGWPADRPVWTGSCPCQPFSQAGRGFGLSDPRHLWPSMLRLISQCRPATCFGEQVASKAGRQWISGVRSDLEALGYAVGCADLCAAGLGAPHIRQRLYWVANRIREQFRAKKSGSSGRSKRRVFGEEQERKRIRTDFGAGLSSVAIRMGEPIRQGSSVRPGNQDRSAAVREQGEAAGPAGAWDRFDLIECSDGKVRRIPDAESGICPLAHGLSHRVVRLRGYGNAIVPQVAATFVQSFLEAEAARNRLS